MTLLSASADGEFSIGIDFGSQNDSQIDPLLLEYLKDMRGLGSVTVHGCVSKALKSELCIALSTPIQHVQEYVERAASHLTKARIAMARGQFPEATSVCVRGLNYPPDRDNCIWENLIIFEIPFNNLPGLNITYAEISMELYLDYALCLFKIGELYIAYQILSKWPAADLPLYPAQNVKAWYCMGLVQIAIGRPDSAVAYFQQILQVQPDHEGAIDELKTLEPRLRSKADRRSCGGLVLSCAARRR